MKERKIVRHKVIEQAAEKASGLKSSFQVPELLVRVDQNQAVITENIQKTGRYEQHFATAEEI